MARQAPNAIDAADAHQSTRSALHHRIHKWMKGCRHTRVVGCEGSCDYLNVGPIGRINANADAGARNHYMGDALTLRAGMSSSHNLIRHRHVGQINLATVFADLMGVRPYLNFFCAPRHQRQAIAGLVEAPRQRPSNAAGRTRDEYEFGHPVVQSPNHWALGTSMPLTRPLSCRTRSRLL